MNPIPVQMGDTIKEKQPGSPWPKGIGKVIGIEDNQAHVRWEPEGVISYYDFGTIRRLMKKVRKSNEKLAKAP